MPSERHGKRIRQACEPCRRKKSKCPGEKPACSCCSRLGHQCIYSNENPLALETGSSHVSDVTGNLARLENLEAKLELVLQAVRSPSVNQEQASRQAKSVIPSAVGFLQEWKRSTTSLPPWDSINAAGALYLLYCECQPLPLFHQDSFIASLPSREPEVLFSILALTERFSGRDHASTVICTNAYTEEARKLVAHNVSEGSVRLSTLQSLCLLNIIHFTNGNTHRASIANSLAIELAHCAGLVSESLVATHDTDIVIEEKRRCFWSIFLCKRLHGASFSSLDFSVESDFPWYPESFEQPLSSVASAPNPDSPLLDESQPSKDSGILAYMIQLSEVWFKTTQYARRRGKPSAIPPWSSQSQYSTIVSQQMEFETRFPAKHRFKLSKFNNRTSQELNSNRSYWGPWLFIQFLYHTNICLLNHPLLLSLRLRNLSSNIPEMFLQQASDLISTHATWVVRFIDMVESKEYKISDPFLGHCAAIVATIHLQHAFTMTDQATREVKQTNFAKCLNFVSIMGEQWPHMAGIAEKLRYLETVISTTNQSGSHNRQVPTRGLLVDLGRFWEILEYCAASARPYTSQNVIATELYTSHDDPGDEVSLASPLPETFRLDDYNGGGPHTPPREPTPPAAATMSGMGNYVQDTNVFPEVTGAQTSWGMGLNTFSADELAVLADNFFEAGNSLGHVNETASWNFGNL